MAKPTGFMEFNRAELKYRPVEQRVNDFNEITIPLSDDELKTQAARCMDCGIPFCHGSGCPLANRIPEFNDHIYNNRWQQACDNLHSTNNFPEITGRICPALCEASCTLGLNDDPVLIRQIEVQIVERGFEKGWIKPLFAGVKTGKNIAVIGSGPAGLAAGQQLVRFGHSVVIYEKSPKPGGLLRFGIPDFKLDKAVIDRRLEQMKDEGVDFQNGVIVGEDISVRYLENHFDAICLCTGTEVPRDLKIPGRELENIHFAMDFLTGQNKANAGLEAQTSIINTKGKTVVVIGGGDTGSDCVGTAIRQGAKEVHQLEILPEPPADRPDSTPWPMWPKVLRTSSSHKEGCSRRWSVMTKEFKGTNDAVSSLIGVDVQWSSQSGSLKPVEVSGSRFEMKADIVLLAMGFLHTRHKGLVSDLGIDLDDRGNIAVDNYMTSRPGVFACGDSVKGASLVVHAICQGREMAKSVQAKLLS